MADSFGVEPRLQIAHPALVPIAALALSALLAIGAYALSGLDSASPAKNVNSSRTLSNAFSEQGSIVRVELARAPGQRDAVIVRPADSRQTMRLYLSVDTRLLVPEGENTFVGNPYDLAAGQRIRFSVREREALRPGATVSTLLVEGPDRSGADA